MGAMRRFLICLTLVTGCRSWDVRAFDVPLSPKEPRLVAATDDPEGMSVWAVLALVAANVGAAVVIQQIRHY